MPEHKTTDLLTRLRLIAAWRTPGGPTPSQPMPSNHVALNEAAAEIERLRMADQQPTTITDSAHDLAAALDQIAKLCAARGVDLVLRRDDATETWTASAEGIGAGEYWEGAYTPLPAETLMSLHEQMVQ